NAALTAGVISASSSGGILLMRALRPKTALQVQPDFQKDLHRPVNGYREWRTPPLWGVADTAPYLHDGRAETLQQAILLHGGEAQSSRDAFADLAEWKQEQLVAFLSSLRAPQTAVE
ncbi:MAG: di-heme oxidoredictase family protein, partial [Planctomycetota bacterium]